VRGQDRIQVRTIRPTILLTKNEMATRDIPSRFTFPCSPTPLVLPRSAPFQSPFFVKAGESCSETGR
jgi:hypothetical protein